MNQIHSHYGSGSFLEKNDTDQDQSFRILRINFQPTEVHMTYFVDLDCDYSTAINKLISQGLTESLAKSVYHQASVGRKLSRNFEFRRVESAKARLPKLIAALGF